MSRQTRKSANHPGPTSNNDKQYLLKRVSDRGYPIIREIYYCLTQCNNCTGIYTDVISGRILRIICRHQCHSANWTCKII